MSGSRWFLSASVPVSFLAAVLSCCGDPSGPDEITPDSAWMAVERLRTAYEEMDVELFRACLDDEFMYLYYDWQSSQWLYWGLEYEELCHDSLLCADHVDHIELAFSGESDVPWSGVPGGDTTIRELTRDFDLCVYTSPSEGFHAQGSVVFVCRTDSTGTYRIQYWTDLSEVKQTDESTTWPDIKQIFL